MKKIIACISLVFAMSAGVTALAADATYTKDGNSVSGFDANGYSTVLITEDGIDDVDDIVYVNQDDSGLAGMTQFLIKDGAKDGKYKMKFGGASDGATKEYTFTITSFEEVTAPMAITNKVENDNGTYDVGCFGTVSASDCDYIAINVTGIDKNGEAVDKTAYYQSPFVASGEGIVDAAVKVTGIPTGFNVTVALTNVGE